MITLRRILHPTDMSVTSERALEYAISLAQQHSSTLYLFHVIVNEVVAPVYADPLGAIMPMLKPPARDAESGVLETLQALVPSGVRNMIPVEFLTRRGRPIMEVLRCAEEIAADIIVCGTHGYTGLKRIVLGSVAEELARRSPCPVLVVPQRRKS